MEEIIRIPEDRVGVLIGPSGSTKRTIEKKTKAKMQIDSAEGEVTITGNGTGILKAVDIVRAIGRGFSPERAFKLFEDDYLLKIIEITDFAGKNSSNQKAKRGRIIGREGLIRKEIEKRTHSFVSVHGKTVAIIARIEDIEAAIESVEMLLQGAQHETMEMMLSRKGKERFEL